MKKGEGRDKKKEGVGEGRRGRGEKHSLDHYFL